MSARKTIYMSDLVGVVLLAEGFAALIFSGLITSKYGKSFHNPFGFFSVVLFLSVGIPYFIHFITWERFRREWTEGSPYIYQLIKDRVEALQARHQAGELSQRACRRRVKYWLAQLPKEYEAEAVVKEWREQWG
jgi:hypothetical protein